MDFKNFYSFEFTIGIIGIVAGARLYDIHIFFILISLIGTLLVFNSSLRWNRSQKNKETIEKLEIERKNAVLDFDIKDIRAERDLDWYPDDVIDGKPIGFNEMFVVLYEIELIVYNPSVVENIVRDIDVYIINHKKKTNKKVSSISDLNKPPQSIESRKHKKIVFNVSADEIKGTKGDKLRITLTSIDNKKVNKDWEIKYYYDGGNYRDVFSK
jgi:hypothetical protein